MRRTTNTRLVDSVRITSFSGNWTSFPNLSHVDWDCFRFERACQMVLMFRALSAALDDLDCKSGGCSHATTSGTPQSQRSDDRSPSHFEEEKGRLPVGCKEPSKVQGRKVSNRLHRDDAKGSGPNIWERLTS